MKEEANVSSKLVQLSPVSASLENCVSGTGSILEAVLTAANSAIQESPVQNTGREMLPLSPASSIIQSPINPGSSVPGTGYCVEPEVATGPLRSEMEIGPVKFYTEEFDDGSDSDFQSQPPPPPPITFNFEGVNMSPIVLIKKLSLSVPAATPIPTKQDNQQSYQQNDWKSKDVIETWKRPYAEHTKNKARYNEHTENTGTCQESTGHSKFPGISIKSHSKTNKWRFGCPASNSNQSEEDGVHGPAETLTVDGKRKFPCKCGKVYRDRCDLVRHNLKFVTGNLYECTHDDCAKRFFRIYHLKRHISLVHSKDPGSLFGCRFCGAVFKTQLDRNAHRRSRQR